MGPAAPVYVPVTELHRHIIGKLRHLKALQLPVPTVGGEEGVLFNHICTTNTTLYFLIYTKTLRLHLADYPTYSLPSEPQSSSHKPAQFAIIDASSPPSLIRVMMESVRVLVKVL